MAGRRNISYFAEERGRNNNPNFFVNMRDEDLRRQVKRIIKDMRNNSMIIMLVMFLSIDFI